MVARTLTITHMQVHRSRKKDQICSLGKFGAAGADLLDVVEQAAEALKTKPLDDTKAQRETLVESSARSKRTLLIRARTGTYGDVSTVRDRATGQELQQIKSGHANDVSLRVLAAVPEFGTTALLFIEHGRYGVSAGKALLDTMHGIFMSKHHDVTFRRETVLLPDSWLNTAQVMEIKATSIGHEADVADGGSRKQIGALNQTISVASNARGYFDYRKMKKAQTNLERAKLIGLDGDPDEIHVSFLGADGQRKTVRWGDERTPRVVYELNPRTSSPLADASFKAECLKHAHDTLTRFGEKWDAQWE